MMANREMKNSGVPWLKDIPSEWEVERGKNVLVLQKRPVRDDDEVVTCFRDGEVILRSLRRTEGFTMSDKEIGYQGINEGDIVIHGMDGFAGAMGVSKSTGKGSPVLVVCSPKYDAIPQYIIYYLRALAMTDVFIALATGIRERSCDLRWNKISELEFILPSAKEQQKIASFLDRKCSEIDEIIALQEKIVEELKAYKQSVITEAVTKGLNPDVPMKDSGTEWIGEIPEHWEVTKLNYFLSKVGSGSTPTGGSSVYTNQGVKFLRSQNVYFEGLRLDDIVYITDDIDESMKGTRVLEGDVLLNITGGSIGRCFYVDSTLGRANVNQHVSILRPKTVHTRYLKYFLQSEVGQHQVQLYQTGGNREGLSAAAIKEFRFFDIPVSEQQTISKFLDTKCTEIDNLISIKLSKIDSLKEYKKSIIYEHVTGKKEVIE